MHSQSDGLKRLEETVARELELLAYPDKEWVRPASGPDHRHIYDCAIIGAGQVSLSICFGLKRERVNNIVAFDENPAGSEGPWTTFARMLTLRTPKLYSGPENGIPSLTFRAWHEANFGAAAWDDLFRIPRQDWMSYLKWYRKVLGLQIVNGARVTDVKPVRDSLFELEVQEEAGARRVLARTIVIATGAAGVGGDNVPHFISSLPRDKWRHSNESFDLAVLKGKRIGVLGAGASAFDNAASAVEAGAASVDVCFRRDSLPRQNPRRFLEFSGFLSQYRSLPDAHKWRYLQHLYSISQPPPAPTFDRAMNFPQVSLRPSSAWLATKVNAQGEIEVTTPHGRLTYDFVIAATGVRVDFGLRPELRTLWGKFATWNDRYAPPAGLENEMLSSFPYLGPNGELQEKAPGAAPWLRRIFVMNRASTLSLGPTMASNSALRYATPMIVEGIVRELFLDSANELLSDLVNNEFDELPPTAASSVTMSGSR
jgi:cation diffusion facilitator CzcD-associated flavoprotein CzcO